MKEETEDAKVKQLQVLQHYNVTMNDLEEYRRNKPLVDYNKQLKDKLEEAKQAIINLAQELRDEQIENARWVHKWRMYS